METFERVRLLRKNQLKLSQEQFGEKLGVSRSVIANIETNVLARPEQKEPLLRLICETFHVNYEWLTTGEGDMFIVTKQSFLEKLAAEYGLSDTAKKIVECYLNLDDNQRTVLDGFIHTLSESIAEAPAAKAETSAIDRAITKAEFMAMASDSFDKEKIKESQASSARESDAG